MTQIFDIAPLAARDFTDWHPMYRAYSESVSLPVGDAVVDTIWTWLMDPAHPVKGLMARVAGEAMGFAHYRPFPRTLDGNTAGYLDDLFVLPAARGSSLARQLIGRVAEIGKAEGWDHVRWVTSETNYRARRLYDQVGERMDILTYRLKL